MKKDYTHIAVLIDRSGSMQKIKTDTIGGYNSFIEEQKKVPGECTVSLYQFSDICEAIYKDVPIGHVANLTAETYKIKGSTSLNDSFAKVIDEVGVSLAAKPEHERPSKVILLIMTDGEENRSEKFVGIEGRNKIASMVKHQTEKYSWSIVFIGAQIDAFAVGAEYGIAFTNTINYNATGIGAANAFKSVSRGTAAARLSSTYGTSMDSFFENERNRELISDAKPDTFSIDDVISKYTVAAGKDAPPAPTTDVITPTT